MGSTAQSTDLSSSTASIMAGTAYATLAMQAVTSSGAYFNVGDGSDTIIFVANASSSDDGAIFVEPGGTWSAGSNGQAASTTSTLYSTATAPIAISVVSHGKTGSSAVGSTTGAYAMLGPLDTSKIKSSDGEIYVVASTGSTKMFAAVYVMPGGSTQ